MEFDKASPGHAKLDKTLQGSTVEVLGMCPPLLLKLCLIVFSFH